jgi:hypothetical protein
MNSYRNLASQKIADTLTTLAQRIGERFPGSGLLQVCRELIVMAEQTSERADRIARPNVPLIAGVWLLLLLAVGTVVWLLGKATQLEASTELTNVMQGVDAGVSLLIVLGGAAFYLSSLESRWRRRAVLKALHEFRSVAHVIDMHQLTKDPSRNAATNTTHSPKENLSGLRLTRYLDYASEMLSLTSKVAALYAQAIDDQVVLNTVNELEELTTGLSQKIWQKIMVIKELEGHEKPETPPQAPQNG